MNLVRLSSLLILLGCADCASIMNSDIVTVPVWTHPADAKATVLGQTYTTPTVLMLPVRMAPYQITVEKEGYLTEKLEITETVSPAILGNAVFLFGAIVGLVIDFGTGRAYTLTPHTVTLCLRPEGAPPTVTQTDSSLLGTWEPDQEAGNTCKPRS